MTHSHPAPSSIRDDSICESSLHPNKSSGDIVELKPCPFCHSEGHTLLRGFRYSDTYPNEKEDAVACPTCEARAPLKAWNTRTPDPGSAAEIERLRREVEEANTTIAQLDQRCALFERSTLTAESAVAAAWEEAERVVRAMARNFKGQVYEAALNKAADNIRASAIRAAVSKKTAESGHSPSTHNSESECTNMSEPKVAIEAGFAAYQDGSGYAVTVNIEHSFDGAEPEFSINTVHRIEVAKWPEIRDGIEKLLAAVSKP